MKKEHCGVGNDKISSVDTSGDWQADASGRKFLNQPSSHVEMLPTCYEATAVGWACQLKMKLNISSLQKYYAL